VTGPTEFLGRHVVARLAAGPFEIIAASRRPPDSGLALRWHQVDLMVGDEVGSMFTALRPTHLIHLAWCAGGASYRSDPTNRDWAHASAMIARRFFQHGGRRALFAGTSVEYQAPDARSLYAASKIEAAAAIQAEAQARSGQFAWGRIFLPYGPHDGAHRLVPSVIDALLAGRTAQCSVGTQIRDFIHVDDVAAAFVALLDADIEGPVDIGTGRGLTVREAVQEIGRLVGREDLLRFDGPAPAGEPESLVARPGQLLALGWRARPVETGFAQTIEWRRTRSSSSWRQ